MKAVVIGAGEVGYHIAKALCATHDVVVIEKDNSAFKRADELDVQAVEGNGANAELLAEVLPDADIVVAVTGIDEVNILACMAAKLITRGRPGASEPKTIARVSNPDYISQPVTSRAEVGVDVMICPELALSSQVAGVLVTPAAIDADMFAEGKVQMMEFVVNSSNRIAGKRIEELNLSGCIVSAVFRDNDIIIPRGDDLIEAGDHLVVLGKPSAMAGLYDFFGWQAASRTSILLIGGGIVGFYLARVLDKQENVDLKIIEYRKSRCIEIAESLQNTLVLNGDGTDLNLLKEENIGGMDAVIAVTDSDEKNLLCALLAKQMGAKKVIARADRSEYISLFEMVGVDVALSPREATVNEVLKLTIGKGIETFVTLEGEKAEIIEYTASSKSKIVGKALSKVKFPKGALITIVVHANEIIIPKGDFVIREGDRVIIFTLSSSVKEVEKFFK